MYVLSFNLKEQLLLLLQNLYEVKHSTPALRSFFTMCDSTRQNGLVTISYAISVYQKATEDYVQYDSIYMTLAAK